MVVVVGGEQGRSSAILLLVVIALPPSPPPRNYVHGYFWHNKLHYTRGFFASNFYPDRAADLRIVPAYRFTVINIMPPRYVIVK